MKKNALKLGLIGLLALTGVSFASDPIYTPWNNNLAIKGYDTVAYFTEDKAVKGVKDYSTDWQGATWLFSSEAHKALFEMSPEKYAPQFGGYCAYAVSQNSLASVDPTLYAIVDDKLYLNYNEKIQQTWLKNQAEYILEAHKNWPSILDK